MGWKSPSYDHLKIKCQPIAINSGSGSIRFDNGNARIMIDLPNNRDREWMLDISK